jgi:hypothetical protein
MQRSAAQTALLAAGLGGLLFVLTYLMLGAALSTLTALLMMAFLTAFGVAHHVGGPAGLFEKLASLTRTSWSVLLVQQLYAGRVLRQGG